MTLVRGSLNAGGARGPGTGSAAASDWAGAGVAMFTGPWSQDEAVEVGYTALAARLLGIAHGLEDAAGRGSFCEPGALARKLGLPEERGPAYDIAEATYEDAYTRSAFPAVPPPPDWERHGRYLRGYELVAEDGRRARLTGRTSRWGEPRVKFDDADAAETVPRNKVDSILVRVFPDTLAASRYAPGLGMGTLYDGDVLWIPAERTAVVMYQVWPFLISGRPAPGARFFEWLGGPDALAAADDSLYEASVAEARALLCG